MTAPRVPGGNPADPFPIVNAALDILEHQEVYGIDPDTTAGLDWGYLGGRWGGFAVITDVLTLIDDAENYIVVERSSGAISVADDTTDWDNGVAYARVFHITVDSGVPTSVIDYRGGPRGVHGQPAVGSVTGPGSSVDNTLARFNGTAGDALQSSGVVVSDVDEIHGYKGNIKLTTASTYSLLAGDSGRVLEFSDGTGIALDLPNSLPVGWCATVVQVAAGAVTFTPGSGANLRNRQAHTKTAGQWAMSTLYVRTNAGGSAAEYVLGGDTAA